MKMSADYEREQADLEASIGALRQTVEACEQQSVNLDSFLKLVRKYTVPDKLFPELLRAFVEKIVVHAPDYSSGQRTSRSTSTTILLVRSVFPTQVHKRESA